MAEILDLNGHDPRAFAREFLDARFEDVRDESTGGWSALCPLCDSEARVAVSRDLAIAPCPNGHTSGQVMEAVSPPPAEEDPLERVKTLEGATLADLQHVEIPPPEWLVEGFVEQQAFGVLFGPPNAGKTFLAIYVICMAAARRWRVKFIEAEGSLFYLRKRMLRAAAATIGIVLDNINISWCAPLDISKPAGADALRGAIQGYDLAVLDSMAALSGGVSENEEEWGKVSNNLAWARSLTGCSVLGVHHATKDAWREGETPELRHLRGHGALAGRADFAFAVVPGPEEDGRVVFDLHDLKEREAGKPKPRRCRVDMVSSAAHFSIEELGATSGATRRDEHKFLAEVEALIPESCDHGDRRCISKTKLENIVTGTAQRTRRAVDQLEHSNRIVLLRVGCYVRCTPSDPSRRGATGPTCPNPVGPVGAIYSPTGGRDGVGTPSDDSSGESP